MRVKSWRIPTWLIVAWALISGLLAVGDLLSEDEGSLQGLVCLWGYCGGVSLWTWAVGMAPLALLWYVTRAGVSRSRIVVAGLLTVAFLLVLMADRQWPEDAPGVAMALTNVSIVDNAFVESEVTLAGATTEAVMWTVTGNGPHTVKWSDGTLESPRLLSGHSYVRTFDRPGTYAYVCGIHPSMTGSVTVTP